MSRRAGSGNRKRYPQMTTPLDDDHTPAADAPVDRVAGEPKTRRELLPLVYDELRRLAAQRLAREAPGQTLQATALVHEAYLRLIGGDPDRPWDGRGHFFAAAAEAMRRILVENARRRHQLKRGGDRARVDLDKAEPAAPRPTTTCSLSMMLSSDSRKTSPSKRSSSSFAYSPVSPTPRQRKFSACPSQRPTATGRTPGRGSASKSRAVGRLPRNKSRAHFRKIRGAMRYLRPG